MRNKTAFGYTILAITIFLWGITFVSTKVLLQYLAPIDILFYRFLIGFVALCFVYPKSEKFTSLKNELLIFSAGVSGILLYFLAENIALQYTFASNAALLVSIAPVVTLILSVWINKDKSITRYSVFGCVLGLAGVFLVICNGSMHVEINPLGDFLAILAAVFWSFYCILLKRITGIKNNIVLTRRIFFYGLLSMLPILAVTGLNTDRNILMLPSVAGNLLFLGLGASALCYVLWNFSVGVVGIVRATNFIYFIPAIGMITAVIVLDEILTFFAISGAVLISAGVYIADKGSRTKLLSAEKGYPEKRTL